MNDNDIKSIIEDLSINFILADPSDVGAMSSIRESIRNISEYAAQNCPEIIMQASETALAEIDEIIMKSGEENQPENLMEISAASMDLVSRIISSIQSVIVDEKPIDRAEFPEEIFNNSSPDGIKQQEKQSAFTPVDMMEEAFTSMDADDFGENLAELNKNITAKEDASNGDAHETKVKTPIKPDSGPVMKKPEKPVSATVAPQEIHDAPSSPANGKSVVRHPSRLPDYIDEKFFLEFLGLQGDVLDKMESLIIDLEKGENEKETIHELKRVFHTLKGEAGFLKLDEVETLCHKSEDIFERITCGAFIDLFLSVKDWLFRAFNAYAGVGDMPEPLTGLLLQLDEARKTAEKDGTICDKDNLLKIEAMETEQPPFADQIEQRNEQKTDARPEFQGARAISTQIKQSVQVDAERLDRLIDMIGELVISETMVTQSEDIKPLDLPDFKRHLSQLDKITRELQRIGLSLRMMPIRSTFRKMSRIVRDLSIKSGKKIELVFSGEDTELDKSLVDKIGDPLMHMVRNAVDHGIEKTEEERVKKGKPATARLEIRAFHKAGNIHIEVEDDGRGIDHETVYSKALERGLITEDDSFTEREIINLIFEPGFSTAEKVTDVSGRGVGMDVVKRNIESMRGQVEVTTKPGNGSIFSIRIPLTLAIIDGMAVNIGGEKYIIPTLSIEMSLRPKEKDLTLVMDKGEMLDVQGRLIPVIRLYRLFEVENAIEDPTKALLVVVEEDGRKAGLLVDKLLGKQQIVIKNLGESMKNIMGISGGAIMPDGSVGLILDIGGIIRLAYHSGAF